MKTTTRPDVNRFCHTTHKFFKFIFIVFDLNFLSLSLLRPWCEDLCLCVWRIKNFRMECLNRVRAQEKTLNFYQRFMVLICQNANLCACVLWTRIILFKESIASCFWKLFVFFFCSWFFALIFQFVISVICPLIFSR